MKKFVALFFMTLMLNAAAARAEVGPNQPRQVDCASVLANINARMAQRTGAPVTTTPAAPAAAQPSRPAQ